MIDTSETMAFKDEPTDELYDIAEDQKPWKYHGFWHCLKCGKGYEHYIEAWRCCRGE